MKKKQINTLALSALFLCLGLVLPFLTGQIEAINKIVSPMHYTVLLCGALCGWKYGLLVGAITPVLRSMIFSMPPMYPKAVEMAFELATYGLLMGLLFYRSKKESIPRLYLSLIISMIVGRVVLGAARAILLGFAGKPFLLSAFLGTAFVEDIPGIALQLIIIPIVMIIIRRPKKKNSLS